VATLPVVAALGGVAAPALIYLLCNGTAPTLRGWAIPTATDIAFALGVLSLLKGIPPGLRLLLLTLAIVDDVVAILIIASFYSDGLALAGLGVAAAGVALVLLLQRLAVSRAPAYVLPGALVWLGMLRMGIHPTLAGVVLGLLTPATVVFGRPQRPGAQSAGEAPAIRVAATLHPWVAFGIMPLFALANAGITLHDLSFAGGATRGIALGIIGGLVLGKPLGIVLTTLAAVRSSLCALPEGVRWRHVVLLGCLGGIGFTMSIFIADLAFEGTPLLDAAKFAVLLASALAAAVGYVVSRWLR
jgi:NhaA family Na+:H+ antiporter